MNFNEENVKYFYKLLNHVNQTEIRIINPIHKEEVRSIFVNNENDFVSECKKLNGKYLLYAGINERKPNCRLGKDVISVSTIFLDIDAVREPMLHKEPATNKELEGAWKITKEILEFFEIHNFQKPSVVMSGNGYQLFCKIPKIELTSENRNMIANKIVSFNKMIQSKWNKVDLKYVDATNDLPRIAKITGSWNNKGTNTIERPHRLSKFLEKNNIPDKKLLEFIMLLDYDETRVFKDREDYPTPDNIEKLENDKLPIPINFLLNELVMTNSDGWMRIITVLSSFCLNVGLDVDSTIQLLFDWQERQTIHEDGEFEEIEILVNKVYNRKLMCPNFSTLLGTSSGFPNMGLQDLFEYYKFDYENTTSFTNPVSLYLYQIGEVQEIPLTKEDFKKEFLKTKGAYARKINIEYEAKKIGYDKCVFCKHQLIFYNKLGKYSCENCGNCGGVMKLWTQHEK